MKSKSDLAVIDINAVQSRLLTVRDQFDGYILELSPEECSRSQIVTLNGRRGSNLKYLPHAFTERGLYMLATVLKSPRAIAATHAIIEAYAQVRELKRELVALHTEPNKKKRASLMLKHTVRKVRRAGEGK